MHIVQKDSRQHSSAELVGAAGSFASKAGVAKASPDSRWQASVEQVLQGKIWGLSSSKNEFFRTICGTIQIIASKPHLRSGMGISNDLHYLADQFESITFLKTGVPFRVTNIGNDSEAVSLEVPAIKAAIKFPKTEGVVKADSFVFAYSSGEKIEEIEIPMRLLEGAVSLLAFELEQAASSPSFAVKDMCDAFAKDMDSTFSSDHRRALTKFASDLNTLLEKQGLGKNLALVLGDHRKISILSFPSANTMITMPLHFNWGEEPHFTINSKGKDGKMTCRKLPRAELSCALAETIQGMHGEKAR